MRRCFILALLLASCYTPGNRFELGTKRSCLEYEARQRIGDCKECLMKDKIMLPLDTLFGIEGSTGLHFDENDRLRTVRFTPLIAQDYTTKYRAIIDSVRKQFTFSDYTGCGLLWVDSTAENYLKLNESKYLEYVRTDRLVMEGCDSVLLRSRKALSTE